MFERPRIISLLAYRGIPLSLTVKQANRDQSTYRVTNGSNSVEFFDVSTKNAVQRLTTMLQHYPAAATINGKTVKTSPFPDVGFVDRRVWHGFTNSVQQVPTTPASSPRCFNAYTAGVLCQIPHLDLIPHTYLSEYPSSYPHWNHVARYVITPVANLDLKTLARCIYDDSFIEFDTEIQEVQQQLQHHAQAQARRTIEACKLPEPINRTAWIRSIENTMDELNSPNFTSMPITSNGKLFTPSTMENQAEMVSALESISRSNAGLVPVTSFYQMVNPGHQPTGCAMSLQFQHAGDEHHALVLTDLMHNDQEDGLHHRPHAPRFGVIPRLRIHPARATRRLHRGRAHPYPVPLLPAGPREHPQAAALPSQTLAAHLATAHRTYALLRPQIAEQHPQPPQRRR